MAFALHNIRLLNFPPLSVDGIRVYIEQMKLRNFLILNISFLILCLLSISVTKVLREFVTGIAGIPEDAHPQNTVDLPWVIWDFLKLAI